MTNVTPQRYVPPAGMQSAAVRLAVPRRESIHHARDGHWVVYIFVAVLCLAGTLFASSSMVQDILDKFSH